MSSDYRQLLQLLQRELKQQEKILEVLARERTAVVKLNQEALEKVSQEKSSLLDEARELEKKRTTVIEELSGSSKPVKLADLLNDCNSQDLKKSLEKVGQDLKKTTLTVKELHENNTVLIRQAMGIVSTTVAILRSAPDTGLPTYGGSGKLRDETDPAFVTRRSGVTREA